MLNDLNRRERIVKNRLSFVSQIGGAGKSTICLNLAADLAARGYKTVLVDLDPQGGLVFLLGGGDFDHIGLTELLVNKKRLADALMHTKIKNLTLLSRGKLHSENIPKFENTIYRDRKLADILTSLEQEYDYIILDTPTGLGRITRMALRLSSHVIVSLLPQVSAFRSIGRTLHLIDHVQEKENPKLKMLGLLLNQFNIEKSLHSRLGKEVWKNFPFPLNTAISYSKLFEKASITGIPLTHMEVENFPSFAKFVEDTLAITSGKVPSPFMKSNLEDFQEAQKLSRKIQSRNQGTQASSKEILSKQIPENLPQPPSFRFSDQNIYREEVWNALLEWALKISKLEKAFIVDERGLIIAMQGGDDNSLEGIESNLLRTVMQMDHFMGDEPTQSVQIKLKDKWFSSFYIQTQEKEEKHTMIICLTGKDVLCNKSREKILQVFNEKMKDL